MDRLKAELERVKKQGVSEMEDLRARLKSQMESQLEDQKQKYEKIIDEMKRNSVNDRQFVQNELQKRIEALETQLKSLTEQYKDEKEQLEEKREVMKFDYEKQIIELNQGHKRDTNKLNS